MATNSLKKEYRGLYTGHDFSNVSTFTFTNVPNLYRNSFSYALFWGGYEVNGVGQGFLGLVITIMGTTYLTMLVNQTDRTFSATVDGSGLTISSSATLWGGLRVLAIN